MKFFQKEVIKMAIRFSDKYLGGLLGTNELGSIKEETIRAAETLTGRTGAGNDFLGWLDLPVTYDKANIEHIKAAAEKIKSSCDVLIVIGIGGSYLGARAAIEFVHGAFYNNKKKDTPDIYFVGNDISSAHLQDILSICEEKDICINVISKSGTTTEPAIAFRIFRDLLIDLHGNLVLQDYHLKPGDFVFQKSRFLCGDASVCACDDQNPVFRRNARRFLQNDMG